MNYAESEVYSGYTNADIDLLKSYSQNKPVVFDDHYIDGFGVKTSFNCVPFLDPKNLDVSRLLLPVPDDGFHAETIEYFSLVDAFQRSINKNEFIVVELGAGWGPWITTGGVIAKNNKIPKIILVAVEGNTKRYSLLKHHLSNNAFDPIDITGDFKFLEYNQVSCVFQGVVWTHDGDVFFPQDEITDMGSSASADKSDTDYRGNNTKAISTPCLTLSSLCNRLNYVSFLHIDIQGSEYQILNHSIEWLNQKVSTMMVATHSRVIEGKLIELMLKNNWTLFREKPCRVDWQRTKGNLEGWTTKDGSQYWINQRYN